MPYEYVGPAEILRRVHGVAGRPVRSPDDLEAWLDERRDECDEPFTFVVDAHGTLLLAPRRSEHVACAGGRPVLAAGEIAFGHGDDGRRVVTEVTNQSTGYCPDEGCWPAVAAALDRAGVPHPGRFTGVFVFRHCPDCGELNLVKDAHYVCVFCDGGLGLPSRGLSGR